MKTRKHSTLINYLNKYARDIQDSSWGLEHPRRPLPSHLSTQLCSVKFTGMNSRAFPVQSRCKLKIDRSPFCMRSLDFFFAVLLPVVHFSNCLGSVDEWLAAPLTNESFVCLPRNILCDWNRRKTSEKTPLLLVNLAACRSGPQFRARRARLTAAPAMERGSAPWTRPLAQPRERWSTQKGWQI